MKRLILFAFVCFFVSSCGMLNTVTRESQYSKMYEEKPVTLACDAANQQFNKCRGQGSSLHIHKPSIGRGGILCCLPTVGDGHPQG